MKHLISAAFVALGLLSVPAYSDIIRVPPTDQAAQVPSFAQYRAAFLDAVVARDIDRLLSFVSPDVELSFGGDSGHDRMVWFLTVPPEDLSEEYRDEADEMREAYWSALEDVLRGGGQFTDDQSEFWAPYTWLVDLPEEYSPFETFFVTGTDVPLRKARSNISRIIARMDYEVLLMDFNEMDGKPKRLIKVTRGNGDVGFVRRDQVRSAVGYRALFQRKGDSWEMYLFLAGD